MKMVTHCLVLQYDWFRFFSRENSSNQMPEFSFLYSMKRDLGSFRWVYIHINIDLNDEVLSLKSKVNKVDAQHVVPVLNEILEICPQGRLGKQG